MRLLILGTAPAAASGDQDYTHMLLEGPAGYWLIDCVGNIAHYLLHSSHALDRLRGILLTHGHADHIYGLPVFVQDLWVRGHRQRLPIYGNADTLGRVRKLFEALLYDFMLDFVEYHVLSDDVNHLALETEDFRLFTAPTLHSVPCHAMRFEPKAAGRIVTYGADTAPSPNVVVLARGSDVLIHEASVLTTALIEIGHATAAEAAAIAAEADVKELWLVHSNPEYHANGELLLQDARKLFTGRVVLARDGDEILF